MVAVLCMAGGFCYMLSVVNILSAQLNVIEIMCDFFIYFL